MKIFPIQRFTVFGNSMLPTLKPGQDVLVFNWWNLVGIKVGDIVAIRVNGEDMVKRIGQMSSDRGTFVSTTKLIFLLPIIKLLWINTHIYFFLGPLIFLMFFIGETVKSRNLENLKYLLFIGLFVVLVNFANPFGLEGALYPLRVFQSLPLQWYSSMCQLRQKHKYCSL